jgi:hypothetical protein
MNRNKYIITAIVALLIVNCCQSQNGKYRLKLRQKVKITLDSLYPHATSDIVLNDKYVSDTTQEISVNCHCEETLGQIILVFDTNGNLIEKDVHYNFIKDLPDTIINYMKKNTSSTCGFFNDFMIKFFDSKGEMTYGIEMWQYSTAPGYPFKELYILKFKGSGELISKKEDPYGTL